MMKLTLISAGIALLTLALTIQLVIAASNCAFNADCDKCGESVTKSMTILEKFNVTVCCPTCSPKFDITEYEDGTGRAKCLCRDKKFIHDYMKGTCWKEDQCQKCQKKYVGDMEGVKVCCAHCEESDVRIDFENLSCYCKHGGQF